VIICFAPVRAVAASGLKFVSYHGYRVAVPRAWPVLDLTKDPRICVRFNRHALYLGRPAADQRCPAHAAGRTEAILLEPASAEAADAARASIAVPSGSLVTSAHGIRITATWSRDPALITRALELPSLTLRDSARSASAADGGGGAPPPPAATSTTATPGEIYTGLGFDACSAPSASQMSAWGASSYRTVGIYIGGVNMACAQPNLSAAWVSRESQAGWHSIPIYVGLQAPTNSCGCAPISPANASRQGTAAAADAISDAEVFGMGPGNPIYYDMEAYARGGRNSPAVLTFLAAWTAQLHAAGYKSGVYSSDYSGISDLVSEWGTGYSEPDELWIANWNGARSTSDPNVPSGDWPAHQRLHQYQGGHNETHGRVTLNIDGDYLDAATAAAGSATSVAGDPAWSSLPTISGEAVQGQTLTEAHGSWSNAPSAYTYQWEDCNTAGISCVSIPGAISQSYTLGASDIGHTIRVTEAASNAGGAGFPAASNATSQVMSLVPLYWLYSSHGNVYPGPGTAWYGSPVSRGLRGSLVTGMAATADGKGYWLANAAGSVFVAGDAVRYPTRRHRRPISGIVAARGGGYWLFSRYGNVYPSPGVAWYGSPAASGLRSSPITGMAATPDGNGYWLVTATGRVFAYGDAAKLPSPRRARPVKGIVAAPGGGWWLYTAYGSVFRSAGAAWYGSPRSGGFRGSSIAGMAATPDGQGYWLIGHAGRVFAYGDAVVGSARRYAHSIAGIVGG
jgi:hypothetical protein